MGSPLFDDAKNTTTTCTRGRRKRRIRLTQKLIPSEHKKAKIHIPHLTTLKKNLFFPESSVRFSTEKVRKNSRNVAKIYRRTLILWRRIKAYGPCKIKKIASRVSSPKLRPLNFASIVKSIAELKFSGRELKPTCPANIIIVGFYRTVTSLVD